MKEFNISDYEIFSTGSSTISSRKSSLISDLASIRNEINSLNDESTFCGPICNSIVDGWSNLNTAIDQRISDLSKAETGLQVFSGAYQSSDSTNANNIGG